MAAVREHMHEILNAKMAATCKDGPRVPIEAEDDLAAAVERFEERVPEAHVMVYVDGENLLLGMQRQLGADVAGSEQLPHIISAAMWFLKLADRENGTSYAAEAERSGVHFVVYAKRFLDVPDHMVDTVSAFCACKQRWNRCAPKEEHDDVSMLAAATARAADSHHPGIVVLSGDAFAWFCEGLQQRVGANAVHFITPNWHAFANRARSGLRESVVDHIRESVWSDERFSANAGRVYRGYGAGGLSRVIGTCAAAVAVTVVLATQPFWAWLAEMPPL